MAGTGDRAGTVTRTLAPFDTFDCKDAKIALVGAREGAAVPPGPTLFCTAPVLYFF